MGQNTRILIQVQNEEADFVRLLWRTSRRTLLIRFFLVCLILGSFSFYAAFATPKDPANDRRWIVYAVSLFVPVLVAVLMFFAIKKSAKKSAAAADLVTMAFDDDGIEIDGPKLTAKSAWNAYKTVLETPDDFVFYVQSNIFYCVPKRFFDDSWQIERMRTYISDNFRKQY